MARQDDAVGNAPGDPDHVQGIDRRGFVKGLVWGAAAGAVGASAVAAGGWLTGGRIESVPDEVSFYGAKVLIGSPAPRGVPLVPLKTGTDGKILGRAHNLKVFQGCRDPDSWPGLDPDHDGDDLLRYTVPRHKRARVDSEEEARQRWWYHDLHGEAIRLEHFQDLPVGTGAQFAWRDPDVDDPGFQGVLLKIPFDAIEAEGGARRTLRDAMLVEHDLVAFDAACPHFCCAAGWHEDQIAEKLGFWDTIFCVCHVARFDPYEMEQYSFRLQQAAWPE